MSKAGNVAPRGANEPSPGWLRFMLVAIAVLCLATGAYRVVALGEQPPDRDVLFFFLAAVVALLADSIKRPKFGEMEFERVEALEGRVEELAEVTRTDAAVQAGGAPEATAVEVEGAQVSGGPTLEQRARALEAEIYKPPLRWEDDPLKDRAPALPKASSSELAADVAPSRNYEGVFVIRVDLMVGRGVPLKADSRVAVFLHQTFPHWVRFLPLENRRASLTLLSRGAFTVGALLPDSSFLALDLVNADMSELSAQQQHMFRMT
jgi:hypothetical protein